MDGKSAPTHRRTSALVGYAYVMAAVLHYEHDMYTANVTRACHCDMQTLQQLQQHPQRLRAMRAAIASLFRNTEHLCIIPMHLAIHWSALMQASTELARTSEQHRV
jgi:hypothetical protein